MDDFDPSKFVRVLGDRRLFYLGDSVAMQHKVSLKCELAHQVQKPTERYKQVTKKG